VAPSSAYIVPWYARGYPRPPPFSRVCPPPKNSILLAKSPNFGLGLLPPKKFFANFRLDGVYSDVDELPDLETVLGEAVRVYLIAKKRCVLQRYPKTTPFNAEDLAKQYPDYFQKFKGRGESGSQKYKVIGKTADVILEEYLEKLGYPRCSPLWLTLANIVIERGEHESEQDSDFARPERRTRRGPNDGL